MLRSEAFQQALADFCAGGEPDRLRLLATYGAAGLRRMLTGVYETLRSAGRELELGVGGAARPRGACRGAARGGARRSSGTTTGARQLLALLERDSRPDRLLDLSGFRIRSDRAVAYEEARRAVEQAALDEAASRDRDLLQELLERFADAYAAAKARESALDFEDLQLRARDLLRDHADIRERESLRFRSIMVDEFQDTNRLQCELVDLLRRPGCRAVLRRRRVPVDLRLPPRRRARVPRAARAGRRSSCRSRSTTARVPRCSPPSTSCSAPTSATSSSRSRRRRSSPTRCSGTRSSCSSPTRRAYHDSGVHWRRAEARAVARRVRELVDAGAATAGEIVVLFAAGTDAEMYEEELRRAGLPTYRATGKGYFGQQQVVDLLAYLRLLQNRYDDRALLTVLASPFVGVSNDALALHPPLGLAAAALRGHRAVAAGGAVRATTSGCCARSASASTGSSAAMPRLSLERLCERVVSEHDYDLAVLALWDGRRRYANMRKLARLARSYEELRGPDVEGFVRFVGEQEALGAHQLEAVAEEEGADAVRLLTIHAAKGLEFEVVIVADAGRDKAPPSPDEILALVRRPLRLPRRRPGDDEAPRRVRLRGGEGGAEGGGRRGEAAPLLRRDDAREGAAHRRRARLDREKAADASTPIGWVLGRLEADAELDGRRRRARSRSSAATRASLVRVDRYREQRLARSTSGRSSRRPRRASSSSSPRSSSVATGAAPPAPAARRRRPSRRSTVCGVSRSRRSRRSSSARTSTTPLRVSG